MGNCCGSSSKDDDHFEGAGRTLGSSTGPPRTTAAPPKIASRGQGRTVGGGDGATSPQRNEGLSARDAAARAAEARSQPTTKQGVLGKKLRAQQSESQNELLAQSARQNRYTRDADAAEEARNYN